MVDLHGRNVSFTIVHFGCLDECGGKMVFLFSYGLMNIYPYGLQVLKQNLDACKGKWFYMLPNDEHTMCD